MLHNSDNRRIVKMEKFHHNPYYHLFCFCIRKAHGHHRASTFTEDDTQNLRKKAIKKKEENISTKISRSYVRQKVEKRRYATPK